MRITDLLAPDESELAEHYPNPAERAADFWVHLVAFLAALLGGFTLFYLALVKGGVPRAAGAAVFALSLLLMLACSALYNLTKPSPHRRVLRRLDEAAIFIMIAGSYTPFLLNSLASPFDIWFVGVVWVAALAGAGGKMLLTHLSDRFWCLVYIGFGWLAVLFLAPIAAKLPFGAILLLASGGLFYTVGVPIYLRHSIPFRRAIWHAFVALGATLHFAAVAHAVVLG